MDENSWAKNALCMKTYGALAVPSKGKGFAVVVGKEQEGIQATVLIDEVESGNLRELIYACAELNNFYLPDVWFGDTNNTTLTHFIREMNKDINKPSSRPFRIRSTKLLDEKDFYSYALPTLEVMIKRGELRLMESKVKSYLFKPEESELSKLELGDYPSIEAMSFAVLELNKGKDGGRRRRQRVANDTYRRI